MKHEFSVETEFAFASFGCTRQSGACYSVCFSFALFLILKCKTEEDENGCIPLFRQPRSHSTAVHWGSGENGLFCRRSICLLGKQKSLLLENVEKWQRRRISAKRIEFAIMHPWSSSLYCRSPTVLGMLRMPSNWPVQESRKQSSTLPTIAVRGAFTRSKSTKLSGHAVAAPHLVCAIGWKQSAGHWKDLTLISHFCGQIVSTASRLWFCCARAACDDADRVVGERPNYLLRAAPSPHAVASADQVGGGWSNGMSMSSVFSDCHSTEWWQ